MNINDSVTNIQQARAIIEEVGELYQGEVINKLRSVTWDGASTENQRKANEVINNMENEYVLNVANVLWKDKFKEIPQYIKNYS